MYTCKTYIQAIENDYGVAWVIMYILYIYNKVNKFYIHFNLSNTDLYDNTEFDRIIDIKLNHYFNMETNRITENNII